MRYKQRKCDNHQHIGTVVLKIQVKKWKGGCIETTTNEQDSVNKDKSNLDILIYLFTICLATV